MQGGHAPYPPELRRRLVELVRSGRSPEEPAAVALALNTRPRKTLGWKTPAEAIDQPVKSFQEASVATTGESVQYLSIRYNERLAEAGIEPSVGSKGDS